ncbi:MAG: site-specific DNA-methyltransferase [Nitrospirota bacterium]
MILQDPPYAVLDCGWDKAIDFSVLWPEWERVIKPNGAIVMTAREPFTSELVLSRKQLYKHKWVWNKKQSGSFQNAKFMPLQIEEDVIVFCRGRVNYYPQMVKGKMRLKGGCANDSEQFTGLRGAWSTVNDDYFPVNILEFPNCANKGENIHPTQKPVDLFRYLIRTYTLEGETVFDGYAGSGTTAVACHLENRKDICCEKETEYVERANKRIEQEKAQMCLYR